MMKRAIFVAVAFFLGFSGLVASASAQNGVLQTGQITPGHAAAWRANGVIGDAGGSLGSSILNNGYITALGITATGTPFCINDALINAPGGYHQFCLGANALGSALISLNAYGGATPIGLEININGTIVPFPGSGDGNVIGPISPAPTGGHIVLWNGGTTITDGGYAPGTMAQQNANAVAITGGTISSAAISSAPITGGTINNTPIGGSTPSSGAFTTLSTTGAANVNNIDSTFYADNYGVDRTGVADSTAALQAAITAACAAGGKLVVGPGTIKSGQVNVTCGLSLSGAGATNTIFARTSSAQILFNVSTTAPVTFSNFGCSSAITGSANACVLVFPSVGENQQSRFNNMQCLGEYQCISFISASHFVVDGLFAQNCVHACIHVENQNNVDSGDSVITNSTFLEFQGNTCAATGVGIEQYSSGGLKISSNKFACGLYNYDLLLAPGAVTSILTISNNSMESGTLSAINLESASPTTALFNFVSITGNQIDCQGGGSCIRIPPISPVNWLKYISVTGNVGSTSNTGGPSPANWFLAQSGAYITIVGNVIANATANASSFGFEATTPTVACTIANNQTNGFGSNAVVNTCVGGSP